jgi:ABC-type transport system involved in Fe-S cluster assembly fused permease/ATPase subunit
MFHVSHLQRSVNEMEELVALHAEPIGVQDRAKAPPIRITRGAVRFDRVRFRYWDAIGQAPSISNTTCTNRVH